MLVQEEGVPSETGSSATCLLWGKVKMSVHMYLFYSCCEDIILFVLTHCGDSTSCWGRKSGPHRVND